MTAINPVVLVVAVTVVVGIITIIFIRSRREETKEKAPSPRVVETKPTHSVVVEEPVATTESKAVSSPQQWPEVAPTEVKLKKRRTSRKKSVDPDVAIIELFEKGKKSGGVVAPIKKSDSKSKLNSKPSSVKSPIPAEYNDDDDEESDDEVAVKASTSVPTSVAPVAAAPAATTASVSANVPAEAVVPATSTQKSKKVKKAKDSSDSAGAGPKAASAAATPAVKSDVDSNTLGLTAPTEADYLTEHYFVAATTPDGWAVVEDKRKLKTQTKKAALESAEAAAQEFTQESVVTTDSSAAVASILAATSPLPVIDIVKSQLVVEATKVGLIIGPKGTTLKALQEATGVEIITPRIKDLPENRESATVIVYLVGPGEKVNVVTHAIGELCSKGYSALLEGPDFSETTVSIHPS